MQILNLIPNIIKEEGRVENWFVILMLIPVALLIIMFLRWFNDCESSSEMNFGIAGTIILIILILVGVAFVGKMFI